MKEYTIYKITNPEGRVYVGKTFDFVVRMRAHKNFKSSKTYSVAKSVEKFGWENHTVEVIDKFISDASYANGKEIFWIRTNMCNSVIWPEMNGFNLSMGGKGPRGRIVSYKGEKRAPEIGRKISKSRMGQTLSQEHKNKLSLSHIGKPSHQRKAINQFDMQNNFIESHLSIAHAALKTGLGKSSIHRVLQKTYDSHKGFIFKYI